MKFAFIHAHYLVYAVAVMCRLLGVSRSGYYAWVERPPSEHELQDRYLKGLIRRIWQQSGRIYGSPRVWAELRLDHGVRCSKKRVARLMQELGIQGMRRGWKRRSLTRPARDRGAAPDLVGRRFTADAPDRLWLADISYVQTGEGWLYLASIMDLYSRRIVGWAMRRTLEAEIVIEALGMAIGNRKPGKGLVHHSDRGSQYTSLAFGQALAESGLLASMGGGGAALDNAPKESFFATLKSELVRDTVYPTRDVARTAIFGFIELFYNRRRRHSALGYLSPDEYEKTYWQSVKEEKAA